MDVWLRNLSTSVYSILFQVQHWTVGLTYHKIEDDLDLPWEWVAVLEAEFFLWAESKMDAATNPKPISFQDEESP